MSLRGKREKKGDMRLDKASATTFLAPGTCFNVTVKLPRHVPQSKTRALWSTYPVRSHAELHAAREFLSYRRSGNFRMK